jgi:hypothetical protein
VEAEDQGAEVDDGARRPGCRGGGCRDEFLKPETSDLGHASERRCRIRRHRCSQPPDLLACIEAPHA